MTRAAESGPGRRLCLGWQYATPVSDPGPPPRRPVPPERQRLSADWVAAQRREERLIDRPLRGVIAVAVAVAAAVAACAAGGLVPVIAAVPALAACAVAAAMSGYAIWQGQRALRGRIEAERLRVERIRADQDSRLFASQSEHARLVSQWQERRSAFAAQKRWYAVSVADGIDRVDVAGGTLRGWSALLTMVGVHRLAAGGEVTVVDLSGGAVAAELAGLSAAAGIEPAVWVLPQDLPRLDIGASLPPGELASVLAASVGAAEDRDSARELAIDTAILDRVIGALTGGGRGEGGRVGVGRVGVGRVAAALRALAQVGDPRADMAAGLLTEREAAEVGVLFGRGATDRVVLERALGMEAQLRALAGVGTDPAGTPRSRLRVIAVDKPASAQSARLIGGFVVTALTRLIDQAPAGGGQTSWRHALFVLGAERLPDDVLDRLTDACERTRSGLVLGYRSVPPRVRQRIGRGNAAVVFMRLGNAEEAKAASEQLGTEHRFVLSQLTETIGTSVTDTAGASYTSTAGGSASAAVSASSTESSSLGTGRSHASDRGFARPGGGATISAQAGTSRGTSESASLTAGVSTSTAWGTSTSRATGDSESLAGSMQRSRELVVEPSELQRLPTTAMIVSYADATGRRVVLADANPAIGSLPVATMTPLEDLFPVLPESASGPAAGLSRAFGPAQGIPAAPFTTPGAHAPPGPPESPRPPEGPNLGPPPPRLDWRERPGGHG